MRIKIFVGLVALATVVTAGCLDDSITGSRPLTMAITVEPETASVNETVTARYTATGTGIYGIVMDWGDGVVDSIQLSGTVVNASGPIEHDYLVAGDYQVHGRVEAQNGNLTSSVPIVIN